MKKIIIVFTCISVIYFGTVFYTVNKNRKDETKNYSPYLCGMLDGCLC